MDIAEPPLTEAMSKIQVGLERAVGTNSSLIIKRARCWLLSIRSGSSGLIARRAGSHIDVPEDLSLKQELFVLLNQICEPRALLASNTSSISITKLGAASGRPDRVIGLHFLESCTRDEARGKSFVDWKHPNNQHTSLDLVKRLGKTSVVAKDVSGFIVNQV